MSVTVERKVSKGTCWNADGNLIEYKVTVELGDGQTYEKLLCRGCTVDVERGAA